MFSDKKIKNLDSLDMALTKLAVASFVLFILAIWPAAMNWVGSISPWNFCIAWILLAIRPLYRFFK